MALAVALKILDPRLPGWGFPHYGSSLAAGLDLHACIDGPLVLRPQAPAVLISTGFALRIRDPEWCALVLPRSGLGHREGLVLGNAVGLIDADYEGACFISAWNRNPAGAYGRIEFACQRIKYADVVDAIAGGNNKVCFVQRHLRRCQHLDAEIAI